MPDEIERSDLSKRAIALGYKPEYIDRMEIEQLARAVSLEEGIAQHVDEFEREDLDRDIAPETDKQIRRRVEREHLALQEAELRRNRHE